MKKMSGLLDLGEAAAAPRFVPFPRPPHAKMPLPWTPTWFDDELRRRGHSNLP